MGFNAALHWFLLINVPIGKKRSVFYKVAFLLLFRIGVYHLNKLLHLVNSRLTVFVFKQTWLKSPQYFPCHPALVTVLNISEP